MFELSMYVYSCNALSARSFAVDRALNSYFMIIMIIVVVTKVGKDWCSVMWPQGSCSALQLPHFISLYHYPKYAIVIGPKHVTWYVQIITVVWCSSQQYRSTLPVNITSIIPCILGWFLVRTLY